MTKIGKLYICDRCGDTGFAGYVGGIDRSGWIDPFGKFEKLEGFWKENGDGNGYDIVG